MWRISFLVIFFLSSLCFVQPREYYIEEGNIPSYMYHKFDYVEEYMFPSSITIKLSLSSVVGTLLYSMDRNNNQLIVTLRDDLHMDTRYGIQVELNSLFKVVSLSQLCTHKGSIFDVRAELTIRILITDLTTNYMTLMCDGGTPQWFLIKYEYKLNTNYPILPASWYSHPYSPNEAHMWIGNHPELLSKYPNPYQMHGCIFGVFYNNKELKFKTVSSNVRDKCKRGCTDDVCNGGECNVFYSSETVCNCTLTFRNGRLCNDSIQPMNVESTSEGYYFKFLKLSWKSNVDDLLEISNQKLRIGLRHKYGVLLFYYQLRHGENKTKEVILTEQYEPNTETVFLAYSYNRYIDARVYNNKIWRVVNIVFPGNIANEEFTYLKLKSGRGVIDIAYKANIEEMWRQLRLTNIRAIDIDKKSILTTFVLIVWWSLFVIVWAVIIVNFIFKEYKYSWFTDRRYLIKCRNKIGWSTKNGLRSRKYWINVMKKKSKLPESRLNTLFEALCEAKMVDDEYLRDIVVLFVCARIFVLPSTMASSNNDLLMNYKNKSINYFTEIIKLKYKKISLHRPYLLSSMIDFLVDASPNYRDNLDSDNLHKDRIYSFIESVIIFMIRHNDFYYEYNYGGDATLLEEYLCRDDSVALFVAVIRFVYVDRDKYSDKVRECLHRELSKEGNISEDIMISYLKVIRTVASYGTKWILSDIDYRLFTEICKRDRMQLRRYYAEYIEDNFIYIFVENHNEGILTTFNEDSPLADDQQKSIECLHLVLRTVSLDDATTKILLDLLHELLSFVVNNNSVPAINMSENIIAATNMSENIIAATNVAENIIAATNVAENIIVCLCKYKGTTMDIIDQIKECETWTNLSDDTRAPLSKFLPIKPKSRLNHLIQAVMKCKIFRFFKWIVLSHPKYSLLLVLTILFIILTLLIK